ncbi:MAG: hypothetical protein NTZ74_00125 [Chloroflexi bacterium]|nr:hypothetical protein [Chloroflexota bacterium]
MTTPSSLSSEYLITALRVLGVDFIMGQQLEKGSLYKKPVSLIAALAKSAEARLRLSLIPLFLKHPEFSEYVSSVSKKLGPIARITFQCYYTAAVWLQKQNHTQLDALIGPKPSLPDYFSRDLGLEITTDFEENLRSLALRQQILSNTQVNWFGTYQHALRVWLKGLELQRG